ncbi:hypothetical protein BH23CHL8_BH23CHL8_11930 [soil metagenome]
MTQESAPFFTLDRGTATHAAALVGRVDGRHRLLAAASVPSCIDPEVVLEDLAWRALRADVGLSGPAETWREWHRLEVYTTRPPRACLVAATPETGAQVEAIFNATGWHVSGTFFGPQPDVVALGEACLDPRVDAVVVAVAEGADEVERGYLRGIWPLAVSIGSMRDDLSVVACGTFSERPEAIPDERLFALPAPGPSAVAGGPLRSGALQLGTHLAGRSQALPGAEGRGAFRAAIASLAVLLGSRVEGLEVGAAAGSRTAAHPDREVHWAVTAAAALIPPDILGDDRVAKDILRWSAISGDQAGLVDRLRDLAQRPWLGVDHEGVRLRLAALRAALSRMQQAWEAGSDGRRADEEASDVLVLGGGAFSCVPPAAAALALVDVVRRPGAATILHDHARILAPLGALPSESERRRILADLMDDCLLPIGSSLITGEVGGHSRRPAVMGITSSLGSDELALEPGHLRLVDLPPGIVARLEIDPRDGTVLGVQGRRLTLEVSGGLGGLVVDTRPLSLSLPGSGEQRRAMLEAWEQPVWVGADR